MNATHAQLTDAAAVGLAQIAKASQVIILGLSMEQVQ